MKHFPSIFIFILKNSHILYGLHKLGQTKQKSTKHNAQEFVWKLCRAAASWLQCYFSYGFSVSVSVIVVIYQLQFQLQLCNFFSVSVTVVIFQLQLQLLFFSFYFYFS